MPPACLVRCGHRASTMRHRRRAAYVPHIAQLIQDLDRQQRPLPALERRTKPPKHPAETWPAAELQRFTQGKTRTHKTMILVLDLLARRPEHWHPVTGLAEALHLPLDKVVGALGGLTRVVKAHHDYHTLGLPIRRLIHREPGDAKQVLLSMGSEQARRWNAVRRGIPPQ